MADDILITRHVEVKNDDDLVNQYLIKNGLANEGDYVDRLLLEDMDLVKVRDLNRIKQHIITGLYLLAGDWVLDRLQGVSYWSGMRAYPEILKAEIKRAINTVEGVDTVLKFHFEITKDNTFAVSATVKVGNSTIDINETINPANLGVTA